MQACPSKTSGASESANAAVIGEKAGGDVPRVAERTGYNVQFICHDLGNHKPSSALVPGPQRCAISGLSQQPLGKVETFVKLRELS
jgi:hypothetical protein